MQLIKLTQAVIVEGKYDKITLENYIDAVIIPTNGFKIFKDKQLCDYIRAVAKKRGIIVMTDSDNAGAQIRTHIKTLCGYENIINVYIPQLKGKEKRKSCPSAQGFLGVEGMSRQVIEEALKRSGINQTENNADSKAVSKNDLFLLGLSGCENSSVKRQELSEYLSIPAGFSSNAFLDAVNTLYSYDEFVKAVEIWQQDTDKK